MTQERRYFMHTTLSTPTRNLIRLLSTGAVLASLLSATPAFAFDEVEEPLAAPAQEQVITPVEGEPAVDQTIAAPSDEASAADGAEAVVDEAMPSPADEAVIAPADGEDGTCDAEASVATDESASPDELDDQTGEAASQESESDAAVAEQTGEEPPLEAEATSVAVPANAVAITEGTYILQSGLASNRVVDAAGVNPQAGANVATWSYNGGSNQKWIVERDADSDWYRLYLNSTTSDLALGAQGSGTNVNAYLASTSRVNDLRELLWSFVSVGGGAYHLVNAAHTNMSLDVANNSTALGANLCLWFSGDASKANQRFYLINANPKVAKGTSGLDGAYTMKLEGASAPLVADIAYGTSANGGNMIVWTPNGGDNQTIYLEEDAKDPGFYTAWIVGTGKVLDVDHGLPFHGTNVLQWEKNGGNNQKWAVRYTTLDNGSYAHVTLTNKATGLVLGSQGSAINSNVAGLASGSANTTFRLDSAPLIHEGINLITPLINPSVVLDVDHASTGTAQLLLWGNTGTLNQRFELVNVGTDLWRIRTASSGGWVTWSDGMTVLQKGSGNDAATKANTWKAVFKGGGISMINQASNLALDMFGASTNWGTQIIAWASHGGNAQHFRFVPADLITPGVYFIQSYHNAGNGQARNLDVYGGSRDFNANVQAYPSNGGLAQKFAIEKSFGAYTIRNVNSYLYVGAVNSANEHGANVVQSYSAQLWKPEICDGGYIRFVNGNGMTLEAPSGNSANVVQFTKGQAPLSERWRLNRTTANYQLVADSSGLKAATTGKRVLFVGNSFTYYNDLKQMVSYLSGAETRAVTLSGAYLGWQSQKDAFRAALNSGKWDYVIIQEQSTYPLDNYNDYLNNLRQYVTSARSAGATPIIYGTWAYDHATNLNVKSNSLQNAFSRASQATNTVVANVTKAFADHGHAWNLYAGDDKHPSALGSKVAAQVISALIKALG